MLLRMRTSGPHLLRVLVCLSSLLNLSLSFAISSAESANLLQRTGYGPYSQVFGELEMRVCNSRLPFCVVVRSRGLCRWRA